MKTKIAFILCFLLITLCGCGTKQTSSASSNGSSTISQNLPNSMKVLYSSKDTLNPYHCSTLQNRILSQLMFDPLVKLSTSYEPIFCLAQSVEVKGKACTVALKSALFSDGSSVTAQDVIFSFQKAKASGTKYAASLKTVSAVTALSGSTLQFTLTRTDPYCANLLTFPIIKSGTDTLKNNDNKTLPPIGCGRYIFNTDTAELTVNPNYFGKQPKTQKIITVDCPDNESVLEAVESQMVDLYFSQLSDSDIPKMNGTVFHVPQNHFVFLGINANGALSNVYLRQAVSAAINRTAICTEGYYSNAEPAIGLFPENWQPVLNRQTIEKTQNAEIARKNLEKAGYTAKNSKGFYINGQKKPLTLTLIVNQENVYRTAAAKMVAEQLTACGIQVQLRSEAYAQYTSDISAGRYDLYLSEVRIEDNMDAGCLVALNSGSILTGNKTPAGPSSTTSNTASAPASSTSQTGSSASAASNSGSNSSDSSQQTPEITLTTAAAYHGFYNGTLQITDIVTAFTAELPVIPVAFKSGLAIYNSSFGGIQPCQTDLFYGI